MTKNGRRNSVSANKHPPTIPPLPAYLCNSHVDNDPGCVTRKVNKRKLLFFPSNSLRTRMQSSNGLEVISIDDIQSFLVHVSKFRGTCLAIEAAYRRYYPSVVEAKEGSDVDYFESFKADVVATLVGTDVVGGVAWLSSSNSGKAWRPLNVLGTNIPGWCSLKRAGSTAVTSRWQDKLVLKEVIKYVQCGLLENKFSLTSYCAGDDSEEDEDEDMTSPTTRRSLSSSSSSSSSSSNSAGIFSPQQQLTGGTENYSPVQERELLLPDLPSVFGPSNTSMPIAAIIEHICSDEVLVSINQLGGSGMTTEELGKVLCPAIDASFHGTSIKNPLLQRTVSSLDLGCLARRLDRHHNRASEFEKQALLERVQGLRLEASQRVEDADQLFGYETTTLAPPPDMPLFEYYHTSEPLRQNLDPAIAEGGVEAPFQYKKERFPARKQGFAVQNNLSHKSVAILRAIMYETHVSQTQFMLQWSYWHLFFLGEAPSEGDLRTSWTLRMRFQQLDERDRQLMVKYLNELIILHPEARFAYMSDATHFANGERLVRQLTFPFDPKAHGASAAAVGGGGGGGDNNNGNGVEEEEQASDDEEEEATDCAASPGVRTPRSHLLSISCTPSKSASDTADAVAESIVTLIGEFALGRLIGGTVDHAALSEIRQTRDAAIRRGVSPMAALLVALGDDYHKTALVMKHLTKGSFGTDNKAEAFHHVQALHNVWYIFNYDSADLMAHLNSWLGFELTKQLKQPQPQRWNTVGPCADYLLELKETESRRFPGKFVVPDYFKLLATKYPAGSGYLHRLCCDAAIHPMDERVIVGLTMESEVNDLFWQRSNTFNRQKSNQGYDPGFRGRDMTLEVTERREFCERAEADAAATFPRTWAAIQAITGSGISMPAAEDGSHGPLDTAGVKALYERKLKNGIAAAKAEFDKLYACWDEPPLLFWWLATPNYGGACARAILKVAEKEGLLPDGADATVWPTLPAGTADGYFSKVLAAQGMEQATVLWLKELGLMKSRLRVVELQKLAQSTVTLTEADEDLLSFQDVFTELDDWLFYSLDVLATTNLICELSFSQIKHLRNANETQVTTDMKMRFLQNTVHECREARKYAGESPDTAAASEGKVKILKPNDTKAKVIVAAQQVDELSRQYGDEEMRAVGTVNNYKKQLMKDTGGYSAKAFTAKMEKPESTKEALTEEDWQQKMDNLKTRPLTSDTQQAMVESETPAARTTRELMRAGHWNDLRTKELRREVQVVLPLLYRTLRWGRSGQNLPNIDHWKKPDVLRMAKGIAVGVPARILGFLGTSEKQLALSLLKEGRLFVNPCTSSKKAIDQGVSEGLRFLQLEYVAPVPEEVTEAPQAAVPTGKELEGRRVKIKWNRRWYKGTIGRYHTRRAKTGPCHRHCHSFFYDGEDMEYKLNFDGDGNGAKQEQFELIDEEEDEGLESGGGEEEPSGGERKGGRATRTSKRTKTTKGTKAKKTKQKSDNDKKKKKTKAETTNKKADKSKQTTQKAAAKKKKPAWRC